MQGDMFTVESDGGMEMKFTVDKVCPSDYGIVTKETMIQCKEPCHREIGCGLKAWVEAKLQIGFSRLEFHPWVAHLRGGYQRLVTYQ